MGNGEEATGGDTRSPVMRGLALLAEGIEELLYATTAGPLSRSELLAALRDLEVARRKIPAIDHQLLTQCADEGVAGELGEKNLTALLHHTLRISQADARARIRAAERLGPRRAITGEPLEPRQATVASAQYAGLINTRHAAIIDQILTRIPAAAGPETRDRAEKTLAEQAMTLTPEQLQAVGQRLLTHVDPDGQLTDDRDRRRRRTLHPRRHPQPTPTLATTPSKHYSTWRCRPGSSATTAAYPPPSSSP